MYSLIITEKPNAAKRVAFSLSEGKPKKIKKGKTYWFEFKRNGKEYKVVPAVGHLFVLSALNSGAKWKYPVFETEWKPVFKASRGGAFTKAYYENIKKLSKDAKEFYSATDLDVEGEVIFYNILKFIAGKENAKRMKFSTLTKSDLENAFENASDELIFPMLEAGLARHKMDFLWGINLSRALTLGLEHVGGYWTLSTGRVQGPTLNIIYKREKDIQKFVPKKYWELLLKGKVSGKTIEAEHSNGKFWDRKKAEHAHRKCDGKKAVVKEVSVKKYKQSPPLPFDLTSLQREAYSLFGYSPKMTLDIAQGLYESALISYPRTSSQKLPAKIGLKSIIKNLSRQNDYKGPCSVLLARPKLKPREGKKSDPAHPSIFPTGNKPGKMSGYKRKVYDLIVRRFLSVFCDPAVRERVGVKIDVNGEEFRTTGTRTINPNWIEFYGRYARFKETVLPKMEKGDEIRDTSVKMDGKETKPPNRYSQASVLKIMEDLNLGTKATRAQILHTLYERDYIQERSIEATALGSAVIKALEKYCPEIISVDLTNRFEKYTEEISKGKRKRKDVIKEAESELVKILKHFKEKEKEIGNELKEGVKEYEKSITYIGKCEKCGGDLRIIHSRSTGKRFVGCTNYPKCKHGFPLPQRGKVKAISKKCPNCGLRFVEVRQFRRRPWRLCVRCGFASNIKSKDYVDKLEDKGVDMARVTHFHSGKKKKEAEEKKEKEKESGKGK